MHIYANLVFLGITGISLFAFLSFQVIRPPVAFLVALFSYLIFLFIAFLNTRAWLEKEHKRKIDRLKEQYEKKIRSLKKEHNTATLEKTIRDGTKTLIKNALDYFKIENIKNEMTPSAAIQNLQLDKYGQIIELLADFSLILPDYEENRRIVEQEIHHQIEIYLIDEKPFSEFLKTIMGKYLLTVNKKIREKIKQDLLGRMKSCPKCSGRIPFNAKVCRFCGHTSALPVSAPDLVTKHKTDWFRKGYESYKDGNLKEAIRLLSLAIELDPKATQAYYNRGIVYKKMEDSQKALNDLQVAARLGHEKAKEYLRSVKHSQTQEWKL
ncbi:hypothetical protein DENIS_2586 [Desulfonema ishimotonii]|uniref:Uncharacterized protein n=1 Tax=Desulfonema ishimotonii TaxID=45657 RepID=A0A401FXF7_9BACT|nr:tetratricopeptide repeat protein [Desulfonema ishimotonii]GBC61624.1 hypothetical protein DENIS_2586 [Desulfonema ishimotonii]